MDQKLLVGIDCSTCGDRALEYAAAWAESSGIPMVVVHVIEWSPYSFNTAMENEVRHQRREAELERARAEIVDPVVMRLRERGIEAEGLIRHGHPAHTINELAAEAGVTNIIVGRRGTSRIKSHLFGSVPSTLVQVADIPVTVVP
jgi:nucleotide-binding universal stress UspA family protein